MVPEFSRRFSRRKISGNRYGKLFSKKRLTEYQVDFVDVSVNGIGLTVYEPLIVGDEFSLISIDETIDLRLVWVQMEAEGRFRCGFQLSKPAIDLDRYLS